MIERDRQADGEKDRERIRRTDVGYSVALQDSCGASTLKSKTFYRMHKMETFVMSTVSTL